MGKIVIFYLIIAITSVGVVYGGSLLVVFWRDTIRRWRLEKQADERKELDATLKDIKKL